jgi:hypothetical protein
VDRDPGRLFGTLLDHADGQRRGFCSRAARWCLALILFGCLVSLTPFAHASPPDPLWIEGVYDGADLYAVEPNHGEVDRISPKTGAISRVVDVSASQGHIVPTALSLGGSPGRRIGANADLQRRRNRP